MTTSRAMMSVSETSFPAAGTVTVGASTSASSTVIATFTGVGAYVPPVLGALLCLPVYVLGREFFSRRAGLWAALIIAVVPAQTLIRSELGYTDHHCAETLLSTLNARGIRFRGCHPRDLIDQALAHAEYLGEPRELTPGLLEAACDAYFVDDTERA